MLELFFSEHYESNKAQGSVVSKSDSSCTGLFPGVNVFPCVNVKAKTSSQRAFPP